MRVATAVRRHRIASSWFSGRLTAGLRLAGLMGTGGLLAGLATAQVPPPPSLQPVAAFAPTSDVDYDPAVPTLQAVTGQPWGTEISTHADVERYLQRLAATLPERVQVRRYGTSWEGRALWYAIVAKPDTLARIDDVQAGMQRLADPRGLDDAAIEQLVADLPAVGWLANCVHGDEPSGTDAALFVLYHLLAARGDEVVDRVLDQCVVVIDPLQNPDGRDRFVHSTRAARGRWADATPQGAEHSQPWPGGRVNHALFDMNRDWFAMSQPETRARVKAFRSFWPLCYVDLHEMGGNSSYYFPPPAKPVHREISARQRAWLERYGRNNARWFDARGFDYFTREAYDSFYPGYGDGWPTFQGSVGMTFEMASARGLVYRRDDERLLHYHDGVHRHFVASMATLETLANGRAEALRAFVQHRLEGVQRGERGPTRAYVFPPRGDRTRLARLMNLLLAQGIEVQQLVAEESVSATELAGGEPQPVAFPAGSFVVPMAQPASTLASVLLEPHCDMDEEFLAEQRRREARRRGTEFYDLSAWSLPLLFGVECWRAAEPVAGAAEVLTENGAGAGHAPLRRDPPQVAYVVAWGQNGAAALLADLLRLGAMARCIDEPFTLDGVRFPAGSYVVRVPDQPESLQGELHGRIAELAHGHGVTPYCADSSWVDDGPSFGTGDGHTLRTPRVVMVWDRPVDANSAGWARYVLEQRYGVPVSVVRTHDLARVELDRFTVLLLPEGRGYGELLGKRGTAAVKDFVERGGVLVTLGSATRWLTEESVALLATRPESREAGEESAAGAAETPAATPAVAPVETPGEAPVEPAAAAKPKKPFDYARAIRPDDEPPPATPGAILRVVVDREHWLGFGYDGEACVVHDGSHILTPVKLDRGTNVAIYAPAERLVAAGFVWEESRRQLPNKAYLVHQPFGRGHVVAFAEDPNVRAFADGLELLLLNAVLLTSGR